MRRLSVWACVSLTVACVFSATASAACERLRVPRASVEHVLLHIDDIESILNKADSLRQGWGVPVYKAPGVLHQLVDAVEDMARHDAHEALVNITLDHTLAYEVVLDADDLGNPQRATIAVTPERALSEEVVAFCERHIVAECALLYEQIHKLVERDWGCLDGVATTLRGQHDSDEAGVLREEVHIESRQKPAEVDRGDANEAGKDLFNTAEEEDDEEEGEEEEGYEVSTQRRLPLEELAGDQEMKGTPLSLPVLDLVVGDRDVKLTVREDLPVELQAALACLEWETPVADCATLVDLMRNATRDHPAFQRSPPSLTFADTGLSLHLQSPAFRRLYGDSQRVFFDGEWLDRQGQTVAARQRACVYINFLKDPLFCDLFPPTEVMYLHKHRPQGHYVLMFAEPPAAATDSVAPSFFASRFFRIVAPTIQLESVYSQEIGNDMFLNMQIRTTDFDLFDVGFRVCARVDDDLMCFKPHMVLVLSDSGAYVTQREMVFVAPIFGLHTGRHSITLLILDPASSAVASTQPMTMSFTLNPPFQLMGRKSEFYFEPIAVSSHVRRPSVCPPALLLAEMQWICDLWRHEWGRYSQNGEDGVLQSIFHCIGGSTNGFYVEFGTEDARECNTRYLREMHDWKGLLMDGRFHDASINLHKEWISPENINELFATYDVPRTFDLLSIDVDFNDYWILEAIDREKFSPRVIVIEVNSHIPPQEPRVVAYKGPSASWDGISSFFGVGVGAMHLWGKKNGYSLVYCESHGVNCFLVRDDVLRNVSEDKTLTVSDVLRAEAVHAPPNFFGRGLSYPPPTPESGVVEDWVWLEG